MGASETRLSAKVNIRVFELEMMQLKRILQDSHANLTLQKVDIYTGKASKYSLASNGLRFQSVFIKQRDSG